MAAASDPTPLSYQLQRANLELQPPLLASPTLHGHGSGRASPAAADRVEARRRRLWQGPGGAGGWRGFFLGPAERYEVQPPGQEYAINAKYWRRLWRITRMGLAEPGTALLAVLIVLTDLAQVMILSSTAIALGGTVSSMTLTYMRLLSPCSPVREAARGAGVPANISAAILAFQDEASRAAKANLWEPGEPYVGVGRGCALEPPPAWSQAFHLPADLWACSPPRGYMPGLGVVGSSFMWASVLLLLSVCGQLCGAALLVRTRLAVTKHLHSKLFARQAFYSTVVLSPTLDNPDQRITDDLNTTLTCGVGLIFGCLRTATGASLIYRVLNTIFNLAAAVVRMNALGGTIQRLFGTLALSSSLLAFLTFLIPMNRVSRLLYTVKKCEGNFRWLHCHLMEHSETVAFYAGEVHEEAAADQAFGRVYSTMAKLSLYGSVLAAFGAFFNAGIIPLMALSLIYFGRFEAGAVFIIWGNLNSGFGACLGIPELYTALSISGGPCHRVGVLIEWLDRQSDADEPDVRATGPRGWLRRVPRQAQGEPLLEGPGDREPQGAPNGESGVGGRSIELAGLCVAPPGAPGLVLFRGLTLTISPGDSTAIVGPSGCGKSSLLRVLAGLWQPLTGTVRLPSVHGCGLFFLPQRSYVRMGTLQDQVTYPIAFRDEHVDSVKAALTLVGLSNLQQERKLNQIVDWPTALGAGELQALAFARLLFHQPTFALMDEATSAMDLYSEARLMQLCGEKGITAISVCHRPSAAGFHKRLLRYTAQSTGMDGDPSSWKLLEVPSEDRTNASALAEAAPASPLDVRAQAARQALEGHSTPSEECAGLGRLFFHRFRHLFQLAIPTWRCWAAGCLYAIFIANCCNGLFLICGTLFAGRIAADVSSLDTTGGQYPERTPWLLAYFCVAPVLLFLVAFTRAYCGQMLALHVRRCATDAGHLLYFGRTVAFAMNSRRDECLPGTGKWQPDQRLQQDLQLLCDTLGACLLGNASGDGLIGCSVQLMFGLIFACCLSWLVSSFVLGLIFGLLLLEYLSMVPVTRASMRVQQAEGAFRVTHARAREFAESIVFYGGQEAESTLLDSILVGQVAKRAYQAIGYAAGLILTANMVGTILATAPAILVSMVVFYWSPEDWGGSQITPQTLGSAQTFFSAIGSQTTMMVGAFASIGSLSGLTHRVGAFLEAASKASAFVQHELASPCSAQPEQGRICLQDVTVASWLRNCEVSPAGVLIDSLSVEVKAGNDLLIHGESGSGKSSLMRVMAGLYPSAGGVLKRPPLLSGNDERLGDSCMFVPQASYALGAQLRDEVAYPSAGPADEARARAALEAVGLGHLERREGMGRATSWASELSGGELQRLGLARVLYHRPAFALLDDATSALDAATERRCLGALRDAGVTLVTVSHREGPRAFHAQRLRLAGGRAGGKWVLEGEGGHQP